MRSYGVRPGTTGRLAWRALANTLCVFSLLCILGVIGIVPSLDAKEPKKNIPKQSGKDAAAPAVRSESPAHSPAPLPETGSPIANESPLSAEPLGPPTPGHPSARGEKSESSPVEDVLLRKGVISKDDWVEIKAEDERRSSERGIAADYSGSPKWYERIRMYGYGQFRYNRSGQPNSQLKNWQDSSVGDNQGFIFRRIRWVVTGQVSDHVAFLIQPDLASNISSNTHSVSMRDAYGDYIFDQDKEYRLRVGLQRVPCSFDNYQASRVRMAIDRADATNSCSQSERDMGIAFMWTPKIAQIRHRRMLDYMYGKGDYGAVNITVYNGQGLNHGEENDNKHVGLHLSWPFEFQGGYLMEIGMNANRGQFRVNNGVAGNTTNVISTGAGPTGSNLNPYTTLFSLSEDRTLNGKDFRDERMNFYVYYPPQPWGFLAEYTFGRGPQRGSDGIVHESSLYGGYAQIHYQWHYSEAGLANVYTRYQEYRGGLKNITGAPDGRMKELELGVAWQPDPQWEFTVAYALTERMNFSNTTAASGTCTGSVLIPTCTPGQQVNAVGNLIRFQAMWFWN